MYIVHVTCKTCARKHVRMRRMRTTFTPPIIESAQELNQQNSQLPSCNSDKMSGATDALYPMDFLEQLNNENSHLAPTFYSAVGVIATLVIVIVILSVGFCCLARYILRRNRYRVDLHDQRNLDSIAIDLDTSIHVSTQCWAPCVCLYYDQQCCVHVYREVLASSVLLNDSAIEETEIDKLVSTDPERKLSEAYKSF